MKKKITITATNKFIPLTILSMDVKERPKSYKDHTFILFIIDEVTNCLINIPMLQSRSEEMGNTLLEKVIKIMYTRLNIHD